MSTETDTTERAHPKTPLVLTVFGVAGALVGWLIIHIAAQQRAAAQPLSNFSQAIGGDADPAGRIQAAVALGNFGLGVLLVGIALAVAGIIITVAKR